MNPNNSGARPNGATRVEGAPNKRKWLLPLLVGLAVLLGLILLLSQCGDDDDPEPTAGTTTAATTATTATPSASSAPASPAGQSGTVVAGGASLLGDPTAAVLGGHDDEEAVGRAVQVQSVPADEGFWVGTSETDRLWVQLTGTRGESDYKVKQGDEVDFTGTVTRAANGFAAKAGVTDAEGADQLTEQGHYVLVPASTVKLSD